MAFSRYRCVPFSLAPFFLLLISSLCAGTVAWTDVKVADGGSSKLNAVGTYEGLLGKWTFAAGEARGEFSLGSSSELKLGERDAGIVVGGPADSITETFGFGWTAKVKSDSGNVAISDLVVMPRSGKVAVCGVFEGRASFQGPIDGLFGPWEQKSLNGDGQATGFFATLDPITGNWLSAQSLGDLRPTVIAADDSNSVILAGPGTLAARYNLNGKLVWKHAAPEGSSGRPAMAAAMGRPLLVATDVEDGGEEDANLILRRLNPETGEMEWERRAKGPGREKVQGLLLDDEDGAVLIFEGARSGTFWNSSKINDLFRKSTFERTLFVVRVLDDGDHSWRYQLGGADDSVGGVRPELCVTASDYLDGNFCFSARARGSWKLFDLRESEDFQDDTVFFSFNQFGIPEFCRVEGLKADVRGITHISETRVIAVGENQESAFTASLTKVENPSRFTLVSDPDFPKPLGLDALKLLVAGVGGVVYSELEDPEGKVPLAAITFLASNSVVNGLKGVPGIILEREEKLRGSAIDGLDSWALPMISDGTSDASVSYSAPVTEGQTRLYLIDTSVSFAGDWMAGNQAFSVAAQKLIRGRNDPQSAVAFNHGTSMLSAVVAEKVGMASSTPVELVSYDVFPEPETTNTTLLAMALIEAAKYQRSHPGTPGVICMAISSDTAATSYLLKSAVESAVSEGITVCVSAGNLGLDSGDFIPAAYGSMDGVICIGAHDQTGEVCSFSNTGTAVDLLAPGYEVPVIETSGDDACAVVTMNGTSPATALTAGVAIIELSSHPDSSPAEIEAAILAAAHRVPGPNAPQLRLTVEFTEVVTDPEIIDPGSGNQGGGGGNLISRDEIVQRVGANEVTITQATDVTLSAPLQRFHNPAESLDSDGDGVADVIEDFHGTFESEKPVFEVKYDAASGSVAVTFPVATDLFDAATPFELLNGICWRANCSLDGVHWESPQGSLSTDLDANDQLWVTATFTAPRAGCMVRLEIVP